MAAMVAHEFNNLLTPIMSYAQMALQGDPDDTAFMRKALQRSYEGSEKAARICESILGFARTEAGRQTAHVADVVNDVFACLARDPRKDGIDLALDVPADLRVAIDPVHLTQVLLNLVLNARKALRRQGGGQLTLTARSVDDHTAEIRVADTGPGIPESLLPTLFDPFVRGDHPGDDSADTPEPEGTGLGLVICRDLVERAGGRIDVDSSPGRGTTFTLTLDLAPSAAPAADVAPTLV
jgi:signal transduction histidine kinase